MDWTNFSTKWFLLYYPLLSMLFFCLGGYLLIKTSTVKNFLLQKARQEDPPEILRNLLKYFFFFTLPCLVLSFIPFSWIEFLFSLWSLTIIFVSGLHLVRWEQTRKGIKHYTGKLPMWIRFAGATLIAVSLVLLSLVYLIVNRTPQY